MTNSLYQPPHQPVTPLLVQLYDTHRMYKLAEDKSPTARQELCEIISGILEISSKPSEQELVADILISLIRQAEHDLKCALADRLSIMDNAPLRLVLRLTEEEIDIAEPVLRHSKVLNDYDLLYIIQAHDSAYWQVIAARENLTGMVVDKLAETRDVETARVLVGNDSSSLTKNAQAILADLACTNETIARPLLQREELPQDLARKLYQFVADDLKKFIETHYKVDATQIRAVVDDVISEFTEGSLNESYQPTAAMLKAAELFGAKGQLNVELMLTTLRRGQHQSFIAQLARYSGLPPSVIISFLRQSQGQGLALVARANDISKEDFISMFMMTRRMSMADDVVNQHDLQRAHAYFDRITRDLAQRLLRGCPK